MVAAGCGGCCAGGVRWRGGVVIGISMAFDTGPREGENAVGLSRARRGIHGHQRNSCAMCCSCSCSETTCAGPARACCCW
jgi:hypothetical protein